MSSKEAIEKFTESGLIVPAREDVALSEKFLDGQKPYNSRAFIDSVNNAKPTPVSVDYRIILDKTKAQNEYIFNQ